MVTQEDVAKYDLLSKTVYFGSQNHGNVAGNKSLNYILALYFFAKDIPLAGKLLTGYFHNRKSYKNQSFLELLSFADQCRKGHLNDFDIVHCHFGPLGQLGAKLKTAGIIRGKLSTVFHGYDITKYVRKNGASIYEHLFKTGDLFLPISERWRTELIGLGCPEKKIHVHHMGVDTNKFSFHTRRTKNNGETLLLSVARLVEKKGLEWAIEAVVRIHSDFPTIRYKIAGNGPQKQFLAELIEQHGAEKYIELLGWRSPVEICELMRQADVFVAPSVTASDDDQEGIPVVLMEAMAQGIPIVSTIHSGIPELVQDGKTGFLVPERDVSALAAALARIIETRSAWAIMGKTGREYVEKYFSADKLNDALCDIFRQTKV